MYDLRSLLAVKATRAPLLVRHGPSVDNPDAYRWRAHWSWHDVGEGMADIDVWAYPVAKLTPKGAWIDDILVYEWVRPGDQLHRSRLVSNDGASAWAKPTFDEAVESIAVRLSRWLPRAVEQLDRALAAYETIKVLSPENEFRARYEALDARRHALNIGRE